MCSSDLVAYVGGPGEMAYFAQVGAVADAMGTPMPLVVPRWSATLVEPAVDRMLGRLGMMVEDVRVPHRAERRIGERAMAPAVREAIDALRSAVQERVTAVGTSAVAARLAVPEVIEGARKQLAHRVERLERRLRAAATAAEHDAVRDLAAIRASAVNVRINLPASRDAEFSAAAEAEIATLIDGANLDAWRAAMRPNTKVVFLETPTNPQLGIIDIAAVAEIAHAGGARVVVDNVFATPLLQKPFDFGADCVVYSTTKHVDGQGRCLGGCILASEDFIQTHIHNFLRQTGPEIGRAHV